MAAKGAPASNGRLPILHELFLQRHVNHVATHHKAYSTLPLYKFAFDLNAGSGNITGVNKIVTLSGHCTCAAWKIVRAVSAHSGTVLLDWR